MGRRGPQPGVTYRLTPHIHEQVVRALRSGQTLRVAAGLAGVHEETVLQWIKAGGRMTAKDTKEAERHGPSHHAEHTPDERKLIKLSADCNRAIAQAEAESIALIAVAARQGPTKTTKRTVTTRTPTGEVDANGRPTFEVSVQETVTEETLPADWRAEAWRAERRWARNWGRAPSLVINTTGDLAASVEEADEERQLTAAEAIEQAHELVAEILDLDNVRARRDQKALSAPVEDITDAEVVGSGGEQ